MRATNTVRRCDITPLRPVERLPDGRVRVDAHYTRAGIFKYRNPDGSERRELRPEAEVFKTASMNTFKGVPFTDDHPEDLLTAATATQYAKGATGDTIVRDDDHLRGTITVYDADTIRKMDAGKLDVSCGYSCDLVETSGVHPVWGKYDAIQTNIVGNHLALVDQGRAGTAAIRMDAAFTYFDGDWTEEDHPRAEDGKFGASGETRAANAATVAANRASDVRGVASSPRITAAHEKAAQAHFTAMAVHGGAKNVEAVLAHGNAAAAHAKAASESRAGRDAARDVPEAGKAAPAAPARPTPVAPSKLQALVTSAKAARAPSAPGSSPEATAARKHAFGLSKKAGEADWQVQHNGGDKAVAAAAHAVAATAHEKASHEFTTVRDPELAQAHKAEAERHRASAQTGVSAPVMRGSAKPTRKDALSDNSGIVLALLAAHGTVHAMAKPATRRDASAADAPDPDPNDVASRNARNPEREDAPAADAPSDEPDDEEEVLDSSMYDADGNMTDDASKRMAASCYAVPSKQKLAIHDPVAVKDSMSRFKAHEFDSADEKHAAFNRITARAAQFGIGTTKFARQHAATLDRKDQDMIDSETKTKAAKADKRKEQRDEARKRADGLATELAAAQGKITSLETDLVAAKAESGKRTDGAQSEFVNATSAKAALVVDAITICGVRKDSKLDAEIKHYAAMNDGDIKRTIIKHVDKTDVPADKHAAYVDALFDGAIARATADAAATRAGANALAAARGAAGTPALPATGQTPVVPHVDAADDDTEEAAAARMRTRTANLSRQPGRFTRDQAMADSNGSK